MATLATTDIKQLEQQLKLLKINKSLEYLKETLDLENKKKFPYVHNIKINKINIEKSNRDDDEYHHDYSCEFNFSYDFIKENASFDEDSDEDSDEDDKYKNEEKNSYFNILVSNTTIFKYSDNVTKILNFEGFHSSKNMSKNTYDCIIHFIGNNLNMEDMLKPLLFQCNFNYKNFIIHYLKQKKKKELIEFAQKLNIKLKKNNKIINIIKSIINKFTKYFDNQQKKKEKEFKKEQKKKNINYTVNLDVTRSSYSDYYQRYESTINEECNITITDNSGNHRDDYADWNVNGDYGKDGRSKHEIKIIKALFVMEKIFDQVFSNYNEDWISFVDTLKEISK
jgi:hypothetical protein